MRCAKCSHIYGSNPKPEEVLAHKRTCDPEAYRRIMENFFARSGAAVKQTNKIRRNGSTGHRGRGS